MPRGAALLAPLLAAALLAAAALPRGAQAGDCDPSITFFPPGAEDFNVPVAWGKSSQRRAGNPHSDQLFAVVLSSRDNLPGSFTPGVPILQVLPQHPLLSPGAHGINESCRGYQPGQSSSPRSGAITSVPRVAISYVLEPEVVPPASAAQAAGAGASGGSGSGSSDPSSKEQRAAANAANGSAFAARYGAASAVVNPDMAEAEVARQVAKLREVESGSNQTAADIARRALEAYTASQRARAEEEARAAAEEARERERLAHGRARFPLGVDVRVGEFTSLTPPPRIRLEGLETLPDGFYCMKVIATLLARTGFDGERTVPLHDMTATRRVCFYKLDSPPMARVRFNTCGPKFSMELTDVSPYPVEVFPNTGKMLFAPVYHVKATLNRTGQWWVPIPDGAKQRFDYWTVLGKPPAKGARYEYAPDDLTPAEGWWTVEVDGGLLSEFPSLMPGPAAQFGRQSEDDKDERGAWTDMPSALQGLPKYAGGRTNMSSLLGVQHRETGFNSFNGPDGPIPEHEDFTLSWDIDGFGHTYCYLDGERRQNDGDNTCRSPINVQMADGGANHTFLVLMEDVCGGRVKVAATFGSWGYNLTEATQRRSGGADGAFGGAALLADGGGGAALVPEHLKKDDSGSARRVAHNAARGGGSGMLASLAGAAAAALIAFL